MSHILGKTNKATHGVHKHGDANRADYVLVDRLQQWKHITKSLIRYHQGLADIQRADAKATHALTETIEVPFHEGHAFLGEGGWQEALYEVRDKTKVLAEQHTDFANTIERTVVRELEGVRSELKAHIAAIEKEAGALADEVDKERATSAQQLTQLQNGIDTFENSNEHMLPQHDPYLSHNSVAKQLNKQVIKENDLQAAIIRFQQQQPAFEETVAKNIQSACKLYTEAENKHREIQKVQKEIADALQRVQPTAEYEHASKAEGFTLDPNTPPRDVHNISFPGLDHTSTKAIKEGHLERKKRYTKSYKESYYILTPSGYLHERRSSDAGNTDAPGFSLFLPECSLGVPAKESDKSHKFHVEGNKAVKSSFESKVKNTLRFGGKEIAYTFRARTHAEMLSWHAALDKLSRETKTPVEPRERKSVDPIAAAVANVGYAQPKNETASIAESSAPTETATTHHQTVEEREAQQAAEDDDEISGGSSAEEEDEEARQIRTAPTTPAPHGTLASPLDAEGAKSQATGPAETLPTYAGNPNQVSTAEKQTMSENGPVLGKPLPVNSELANEPTASTST